MQEGTLVEALTLNSGTRPPNDRPSNITTPRASFSNHMRHDSPLQSSPHSRNSIFDTETPSTPLLTITTKSSIESLRSPVLKSPSLSPFSPSSEWILPPFSHGRLVLSEGELLGNGQSSLVSKGTLYAQTVILVAAKRPSTRHNYSHLLHEERILSRIHNVSCSVKPPSRAILSYYGFYKVEDSFALALELCDENLHDYVLRNKTTNLDTWMTWLRDTLEGLVWLRDCGIIHGDVKPQNILVKDLQVRISDFSSAFVIGDIHDDSSMSTMGTTEYSAPEIFNNASSSFESDLWSTGLTFWFVLTGTNLNGNYQGTAVGKIIHLRRRSSSLVDEIKAWKKGTAEGSLVSQVLSPLCQIQKERRWIDWATLRSH